MSHPSDILDLDSFQPDAISVWLETANDIARGRVKMNNIMRDKILCPIFMQESSRTFINATTSFRRLGGSVLALTLANTRFGSKWAEPVQDFATLINSCCDHVILRSSRNDSIAEFSMWCDIPMINAGNGSGNGSEHPIQALVDLYTMQQEYGLRPLNILMIGGEHIRTTRTQIKLFHKFGHQITILSPESPVSNSDIEPFYRQHCQSIDDVRETDLSQFDIIYHNGIDEDPNAFSTERYLLTRKVLERGRFAGKVMHSLPRKNELCTSVDDTQYNLYFAQMENSKFVFQSIYYHQKYGLDGVAYHQPVAAGRKVVPAFN